MAFVYQQQIGTFAVLDSTAAQVITVGVAGVPAGSLIVIHGTSSSDPGAVGFSDSKGNTWTNRREANDPIDANVTAIGTCVVTTPLVNGDTITITFNGTFSWKTGQAHEFRADDPIIFVASAQGASSFPHTTMPAGTLTSVAGDLLVSGARRLGGCGADLHSVLGLHLAGLARCGRVDRLRGVRPRRGPGSVSPSPTKTNDAQNAGVAIQLREDPEVVYTDGPPLHVVQSHLRLGA